LRELEALLVTLAGCEKSGQWPDYSGTEIADLDVPEFAYGQTGDIDLEA